MNLYKKRIVLAFLASLLLTLFTTVPLMFFAPFLVILYYKKPLVTCLWWSLLCGLIVDLLSIQDRLGIHAMNYCIITWFLYRQRRNFFADSASTLPIMTFFFSVFSTLVEVILIDIFGTRMHLTWEWAMTDLLILPLFDAGFAFCYFILPFILLGKRPRKGQDYFLKQ